MADYSGYLVSPQIELGNTFDPQDPSDLKKNFYVEIRDKVEHKSKGGPVNFIFEVIESKTMLHKFLSVDLSAEAKIGIGSGKASFAKSEDLTWEENTAYFSFHGTMLFKSSVNGVMAFTTPDGESLWKQAEKKKTEVQTLKQIGSEIILSITRALVVNVIYKFTWSSSIKKEAMAAAIDLAYGPASASGNLRAELDKIDTTLKFSASVYQTGSTDNSIAEKNPHNLIEIIGVQGDLKKIESILTEFFTSAKADTGDDYPIIEMNSSKLKIEKINSNQRVNKYYKDLETIKNLVNIHCTKLYEEYDNCILKLSILKSLKQAANRQFFTAEYLKIIDDKIAEYEKLQSSLVIQRNYYINAITKEEAGVEPVILEINPLKLNDIIKKGNLVNVYEWGNDSGGIRFSTAGIDADTSFFIHVYPRIEILYPEIISQIKIYKKNDLEFVLKRQEFPKKIDLEFLSKYYYPMQEYEVPVKASIMSKPNEVKRVTEILRERESVNNYHIKLSIDDLFDLEITQLEIDLGNAAQPNKNI